ncbi:MAG: hypothetical protein AUI61_01120 [Thaumarchaeota archaeon 13_1_40CM_2_39_13_2]|nr:MAG: hypothetical protein AUI61_01120 [Thaumarchaeota archaeon 13_1_40CM_2_39_13_2]
MVHIRQKLQVGRKTLDNKNRQDLPTLRYNKNMNVLFPSLVDGTYMNGAIIYGECMNFGSSSQDRGR